MNPNQPAGTSLASAVIDPFSIPTNLARLLAQGGQGYVPTDGFHIYTELRTTERARAAEDERGAAKYLRNLTDYVNFGASAASVFNVTLLEAQGEVLHFFKEGPRTRQSLIQAIQFAYLFTSAAYSHLRSELGNGWHGLAASLDGGETVILRHSNYSSSSAISLSPSANRPAKRLLYQGTKARNLDIHKDSAALLALRPTSGDWHEMNLVRETLPFSEEVRDAGLGRQLDNAMRVYMTDQRGQALDRISLSDARNFTNGAPLVRGPLRLKASSVRCDLDGFSAMVQQAFDPRLSGLTIQTIVTAFLEILRFGDYMLNSTQGAIQLPWAGDCATTILPDLLGNGVGGQPRWLEFAMRWQREFQAGAGDLSQRTRSLLLRYAAKWAVGGCRGDGGINILAPIAAQGRSFLIGVGWPVCMSLDAQNLGKGDDIVTRKEDYQHLDGAAQCVFKQVSTDTDFWKARELTQDKLRKAAVEVGKSPSSKSQEFLARASTISVPPARPYFQ